MDATPKRKIPHQPHQVAIPGRRVSVQALVERDVYAALSVRAATEGVSVSGLVAGMILRALDPSSSTI